MSQSPKKKIVITGGAGFVGTTLALAFRRLRPEWELLTVDNLIRPGSEGNRSRLKEAGIPFRHADLRVRSDIDSLPKADWLIDAAANASVLAGLEGDNGSRQLIEHNLGGTIDLLEYCKRHKAGFLLLSTSRVYSIPELAAIPVQVEEGAFAPDPLQLDAWPAGLTKEGVTTHFSTRPPVSLYGTTKLASELLALEYASAFGFPAVINRCGNLAGAGQFGRIDQGIFAYWINAWLQKKTLKYIGFDGQGHQVRDCLHPDDLAALLVLQIENPGDAPSLQNVSGGKDRSISLRNLSAWCEKHLGAHPVEAVVQTRPFDIPWMVLDAAEARARWNWTPQRSLDSIFSEIADHAKAHPRWIETCLAES